VPTVAVNPPKTPVTKGSSGVAAATIPNVCKMPGPPAPFVPTPLPNIGQSSKSPDGYSTSVKIEGQPVAIQGASFGSSGDIASKGTGGGIVSSNAEGPTKFIGPGSFDVKIEGKNVQLLGDQMLNNCGPAGSPANAATMMGLIQAPGTVLSAAYVAKRAKLDAFMETDKKPGSTEGDGTTAAALDKEVATLTPVKGRWHYQKAKYSLCNGYKKRDDDYVREEKNGQLSKEEASDLKNDTTEGYVRNADAVTRADAAVPSPPWPT
jgi:uncharacterized Zn-binding protein involved in type VI secretion